METKELITKHLGLNLKQFAQDNGFDLDTLNNFLSGKTKGDRKGTQAYYIKQFLITNGLYKEEFTAEELDINTANIKNILLKNFFALKFNKRLKKNETLKDIIKYSHKKVPAILDLYFDMTVEEYLKDSYFIDKNINRRDFSQFCFGTSDGSKKGSKAYYIKQKLLKDGVLPHISIKLQ